MDTPHYLGIDIGSVSIGLVLIDERRQILHHEYLFHYGNIAQILAERLAALDLSHVVQVGHNYRSGDFFADAAGVAAVISINDQLASIEGILYQHPHTGSAFAINALIETERIAPESERFFHVFDDDGDVVNLFDLGHGFLVANSRVR